MTGTLKSWKRTPLSRGRGSTRKSPVHGYRNCYPMSPSRLWRKWTFSWHRDLAVLDASGRTSTNWGKHPVQVVPVEKKGKQQAMCWRIAHCMKVEDQKPWTCRKSQRANTSGMWFVHCGKPKMKKITEDILNGSQDLLSSHRKSP